MYTPWTSHRHEPVYKPSRTDDGWMTRRGVLFFITPPRIDTTPHTTSCSTYHTSETHAYTRHTASTAAPAAPRRPSSDRPIRECATRRGGRRRVANGDAGTRWSRRRTSRDSIAVWERARRRHGGGIVWITLASSRSDRRSSDADVHRSVTTGDGVNARVNARGRWVRWSGDRPSVEWTRDG